MPTTDELIDEMADGKHAFRDGQDRDACPHAIGTSLGNAWRRGWDAESWSTARRAEAQSILSNPTTHSASLLDMAARTIASAAG